jgi:hypothetical protein
VSEMVDRLARAITSELARQNIAPSFGPGLLSGVNPPLDVGAVARAAIDAMREPSEEMRHAAKIWPTAPDSFEQDVVMGNMDGVEIYRAMIDAALPPR